MERDSLNFVSSAFHKISTHTLTWSVTAVFASDRPDSTYFNSHAHVERDMGCTGNYLNSSDFNSHAHVERDKEKFKQGYIEPISTHTLTWSVTH